jgi:hypothetical protein
MMKAQALDTASTTAKHTVGQRYLDSSTGAEYVYVKASEAITKYMACSFDSVYAALKLTKTEADKLYGVGIAMATIASASYGWLLVAGGAVSYVSTINAPLAEVALYTSATAGALDDCSTSQTKIPGIFCSTAGSCSTAENTAVFITRRMGV